MGESDLVRADPKILVRFAFDWDPCLSTRRRQERYAEIPPKKTYLLQQILHDSDTILVNNKCMEENIETNDYSRF